jgi:glycosyltransferase involved in cell wall biosynthesis
VIDLAVVAQDPNFGGGARAHLEAFVRAARDLGREPEVLFVPHPTLRPDTQGSLLDRIETLRIVRGSRALVQQIREAHDVWVVATVASHGLAAARSGRPYACWLATSLTSENRGRAQGLRLSRRAALHVNAPFVGRLEREVLAGASAVYAIGPSSRDEIAEAAGIDPARVGIIPIPVDTDAFTPEDDEQWLERLGRPVIAFVGRADDPRKNVSLLLAALPAIRLAIPHATVRLVGQPPVGPLPDGVEVLGLVDDLPRVLRRSTLFVLPSLQEGFGIAAAEALACGVPVISTRSGGPESLIRESGGGVLLDASSSDELAGCAIALLGDRERMLELRACGRTYVERAHTLKQTVEALAAAGAAAHRS